MAKTFDAVKAFPDTFSTRWEAERAIAERELAGLKKPRRFPASGRWHLVDHTGGVTLSIFIQCAMVEARRLGLNLPASEIARNAAHEFRALAQKRREKNEKRRKS
ncbi:MAG: hypothetical protein V7638_3884 [Acidobacteriota bacterium]|jgi:hypothetical protein